MRTWQSIIVALRQHGPNLPEPFCDAFEVAPPSGGPWPTALPRCPPLQEFYSLIDGGHVGVFSFLPLAEIEESTAEARDWMGDPDPDDDGPPLGKNWFVFGHNEYDHRLIWDADRDAVLQYDSDGGDIWSADDRDLAYDGSAPASPGRVGMARFLDALVPAAERSGDQSEQFWIEALRALDRVAAAARPG